MHQQRGLSLLSTVILGLLLVMGLVYLKAFVVIPYTAYKVGIIADSLSKETRVNVTELKKLFDQRLQFENLQGILTSDDMSVVQTSSGASIRVEYEHCEILWRDWTICSEQDIKR